MSPRSSTAQTLRKILLRERERGHDDATVIGGLDRFLQRWAAELAPLIEGLGTYSSLGPQDRARWAQEALARIETALADGGAAAKASPPRARRPSRGRRQAARTSEPPALSDPVERLPGVSKKTAGLLAKLGVRRAGDLLYLIPRRHNDFANVRKVAELRPGEEQTIVAVVWECVEVEHRRGLKSAQAILGDDTGNVRAVWFGQHYLARTLTPGARLVVSGKVGVFRGQFVFENPEYELLRGQEELVHTGRLVPVYPTVEGLTQRNLRRIVKAALDALLPQVQDPLPSEVAHRTGLISLATALQQVHYPDSRQAWSQARRRLAFDELFLMQLAVLSRKRAWQEEGRATPLRAEPEDLAAFLDSLPFRLTAAQERALGEVLADLESEKPMARLLQGDVGSGKTVVATAALLVTALAGHQGALMAPTEILAEQHFMTLTRLLAGLPVASREDHLVTVRVGPSARPVTVALLLGSLPKRIKDDVQALAAAGQVDIVVGTHALIQPAVSLPRLALAVVDEQHRFGVMQRAALREKGARPHLLVMSATPIPRSLALSLYGDLDLSVIDELPPGRQPARTRWVSPERREEAYAFLRQQVRQGRQVFVICPLIEESEAVQTRAAVEEHRRLSQEVLPDLRLGLLHGRMALREKEEVMEAFRQGDLDVLVATPVVEVGIDVPNATVMLVEGADRFGLSQLHQLRGRVGRGAHQGWCLLLADAPGEEARERLRLMERVHDGFQLAEEDLRLRGPGDYLGTRQSGLPSLRVARLSDTDLLAVARREAARLLERDPHLEREEHRPLAAALGEYAEGAPGEIS